MAELEVLLKEAARRPDGVPSADALWTGARRRRIRRSIAGGVAAGVLLLVVVPLLLPDGGADVELRNGPPDQASPPGTSATERPPTSQPITTLQQGGAEFDVPSAWEVERLGSISDGAVCLTELFGGHVAYVADGIYPAPCPMPAPGESATTSAIYATTLSGTGSTSDDRVRGDLTLTDHASAYVERIGGLDWYQYVEFDLLLIVQPAEASVVDRIVNSVRPEGFEPPVWDGPPSQSPKAAERDGVPPELAAIPVSGRVTVDITGPGGRGARASAPEGHWVISIPSEPRQRLGRHVIAEQGGGVISLWEYGEILLMDEYEARIKRAYPFPGMTPHRLFVTDEAIYAIRQGDGALPDSMLARIDRETGDLLVRVFPTDIDEASRRRYRKRGWIIGHSAGDLGFDRLEQTGGELRISGSRASAVVDPITLELSEITPS